MLQCKILPGNHFVYKRFNKRPKIVKHERREKERERVRKGGWVREDVCDERIEMVYILCLVVI